MRSFARALSSPGSPTPDQQPNKVGFTYPNSPSLMRSIARIMTPPGSPKLDRQPQKLGFFGINSNEKQLTKPEASSTQIQYDRSVST